MYIYIYVQTEACFLLYICMYILYIYKNVLMCIYVYTKAWFLSLFCHGGYLWFLFTLLWRSSSLGVGEELQKTKKTTQLRENLHTYLRVVRRSRLRIGE